MSARTARATQWNPNLEKKQGSKEGRTKEDRKGKGKRKGDRKTGRKREGWKSKGSYQPREVCVQDTWEGKRTGKHGLGAGLM